MIELARERESAGADAFLERLGSLRLRFTELAKTRDPELLEAVIGAFASHRFDLVDEPREYAEATSELLCLSLVASEVPERVIRALQDGVVRLSGVLAEEGVPQLFAQLLKRLRELARARQDAELRAWVDAVISALPE
ncbi:MAG TPA: hypothetical protein VG963_13500 [Polyangiaceae bacterium]|nr:hypothetical protein [Polyangiaceae bacterium]